MRGESRTVQNFEEIRDLMHGGGKAVLTTHQVTQRTTQKAVQTSMYCLLHLLLIQKVHIVKDLSKVDLAFSAPDHDGDRVFFSVNMGQ